MPASGPECSRVAGLDKSQILALLQALSDELGAIGVAGELHLVGGAVMCIAFEARPSTKDLDAYFRPTYEVRAAAARIALRMQLEPDWLNDAVKGFLGDRGDWNLFLDLANLKVYVAAPEYLLALKAAAMRIGEGYQDLDDGRYLLRYLNITDYPRALETIARYFDLNQLPAKTRFALEEILG